MQGCTLPTGCIETLSASLSRQLTVDYDYVWFVPSGAVKDDLRQGTLTALPVTSPGAGEPLGQAMASTSKRAAWLSRRFFCSQ